MGVVYTHPLIPALKGGEIFFKVESFAADSETLNKGEGKSKPLPRLTRKAGIYKVGGRRIFCQSSSMFFHLRPTERILVIVFTHPFVPALKGGEIFLKLRVSLQTAKLSTKTGEFKTATAVVFIPFHRRSARKGGVVLPKESRIPRNVSEGGRSDGRPR